MGYKVGYKFNNQEELSYNAQVFASIDDAISAGNELMTRWILPIGFEVTQSDDPINYEMVDGRPKGIVEGSNA